MSTNSILLKIRSEGVETFYDCESILIDRDKKETTLTCYDRAHAAYVDVYLETGEVQEQIPRANAAADTPVSEDVEEAPKPAKQKKNAEKNPLLED